MNILRRIMFKVFKKLLENVKFSKCIECNESEIHIRYDGLCVRCYERNYYREKRSPLSLKAKTKEVIVHKKNTKCGVRGCLEKAAILGFCKSHYRKWRYSGHPLGIRHGILRSSPSGKELSTYGKCSVDGCQRYIYQNGKCGICFWRDKRNKGVEHKPPAIESDTLKFEIHTGTGD